MRCCRGLLLALLSMVVHSATLDADEPTPTTTTPEMERGLDALDSGHWASAMEIFQALSESQPDQPAAAYYLGVSAAHEGNDVVAAEAFSKAAAIDPSYGWVQANLGLTFFRLGELKPAEDHLLEALLQGPDDADVLLHLGIIDARRKEYDRALRLFEQSADQDPEVAALAMLQAANVEFDRGDLPAALDFLERARSAPGPASSRQAADKLLATLAIGSIEPARYGLRASVGFELDDNVTLSEQDVSTGLADESLVLDAGLDIYLLRKETAWISVGYDLYQSLYRTLTDFDFRIHEPRLIIAGSIGRVYPSFTYAYRNETLGSNGFLSSHQLDLDLEIALVGAWSALLGGEAERIAFDQTPDRTGYLSTLSLGQRIRLFDDLVSLSLIWEPSWQRTDGLHFNYDGQAINAQIALFIPRGRGLNLALTYEYSDRDYTDPSSGFGLGYRHDRRHILWTGLRMPLARFAEISVDYLHIQSRSTLPILNYSQNILTFRLGFWH